MPIFETSSGEEFNPEIASGGDDYDHVNILSSYGRTPRVAAHAAIFRERAATQAAANGSATPRDDASDSAAAPATACATL